MTKSEGAQSNQQIPFGGYYQTWVGQSDVELTRVGPGTPCGDYLRRYWHPVSITARRSDNSPVTNSRFRMLNPAKLPRESS